MNEIEINIRINIRCSTQYQERVQIPSSAGKYSHTKIKADWHDDHGYFAVIVNDRHMYIQEYVDVRPCETQAIFTELFFNNQ